jgi:hypothetical protein
MRLLLGHHPHNSSSFSSAENSSAASGSSDEQTIRANTKAQIMNLSVSLNAAILLFLPGQSAA